MGDFLIDQAKNAADVMPAALAFSALVALVAAGLAIKFWQEGGAAKTLAIVCGVVSTFAFVALLSGTNAAQAECERLWQEEGQVPFTTANCGTISECDDKAPFPRTPSPFDPGPCGAPATVEFP